MSKAILDGFINSVIDSSKGRYDRIVRQYLGKNNPHLIVMTLLDFEVTIVDNFLKALTATGKKTYPKDIKKLKEIAREVFNKYPAAYNSSPSVSPYKARYAKKTGTTIRIYQPMYNPQVRKTFLELANAILSKKFIRYTKEQEKRFNRRTQFLHTGTSDVSSRTVGSETVSVLGRSFGANSVATTETDSSIKTKVTDAELEKNVAEAITKAVGDIDFNTEAAVQAGKNAVLNMIDEINWVWRKVEKNSDNIYRGKVVVRGTLGTPTFNKGGDEEFDWKNLRPKIEQKIFEEMTRQKVGFATVKGSQSSVDKIAAGVENAVVKELKKVKGKNIKVKTPKTTKQQKPKTSKGSTKKTGGRKAPSKTVKTKKRSSTAIAATGTSATKKGSKPRDTTLKLQTLINRKLPGQLKKNMVAPRLVYRTGRFASSAKVNLIDETQGGFPRVQYTYMKYPYQTFEPGFLQGSVQRDPRKLIEKSIREIAVELLKTKYYFRRV